MHINSWVQASDLMKMMKSANSISTFSSEEGLPDNHVITIRERELTVDFPELIQNNIKTDTVTLDLDAEWDGIHPVIIFGPNASGTIAVEYTGEPVHIPGAVMQYVGGLDCSVMGLDDSGEVRLVTKAAPNTFEVVESGEYIGQISEDDVSLLGQILSAIKDVETATSDASSAAEDATAAADSANTAATKATDAANSANTASERAENAYDVLTPIIAEIGVNGNQPRATTSPNYIATASDAYAAKPLEICIKGKTWVNRWPALNSKWNGITVSTDETGLITVTGELATPTSGVYISMGINGISANKSITALCSRGLPDGVYLYVNFRGPDNTPLPGELQVGFSSTTETWKSATVPANTASILSGVAVKPGTVLSGSFSFRVMLVEGTEPPDCFTPCASITSAQPGNLVTAGKNLLTETLEGAAPSGSSTVLVDFGKDVTADDMTLSVIAETDIIYGTSDSAFVNFLSSDGKNNYVTTNIIFGASGSTKAGQTKIVSIPDVPFKQIICYFRDNEFSHFDNSCRLKLQLELGSTATAYEPPSVTETPLPEVELRSLPNGTCDELVIKADGSCQVERKTMQVTFDGSEDEEWILRTSNNGHGIANFRIGSNLYSTLGLSAICDTLPIDDAVQANATRSGILIADKSLYIRLSSTTADTVKELKTWLKTNPTTVVFTNSSMGVTEPQSHVTLPTLPSPNITVYHDSDVPSDITVEYVQDINIVLDNLNAKIAALNVAQSSSS